MNDGLIFMDLVFFAIKKLQMLGVAHIKLADIVVIDIKIDKSC